MDNITPKWISNARRFLVSRLSNERGEVAIPFMDSVAEEQKPAVTSFITNSGATEEDLKDYKSFDEFLSGYKPKAQADWTSSLDAEHKALVGVKNWKSPADTIKSYKELEKLVGHEKIAMPKKGADGSWDKADFERVMTQLGLPKDPKEYKESANFKLPEGIAIDDKLSGEFKARAKAAGLLPHQYAFMMDELSGLLTKGTQAEKEAKEQAHNQSMLDLRTKWGLAYDQKVKLANGMLANYGGDKADEVAKKYGNDPAVIELLATIGADLSEEVLQQTNMSGTLLDPEAAKLEIAKIRAERGKELMDVNDAQHTYWVNKLAELYKMVG